MSLRVIKVVCICLFALPVLSQKRLDSLLKVARQSTDTIVKVDALNSVAFELRNTDPDSAILVSKRSEGLAWMVDYPLGIADAKMRRGIALTSQGNYYDALRLFLEVKTTYERLKDRARIAALLNNIGRIYNFIEDDERALKHYEESVMLFAELKNLPQEASILNNIGYIHKLNGDFNKSLEYLDLSYQKALLANRPSIQNYPIYNKGSVYMKMDLRDSAFKYLHRSLEMAQRLRNQYLHSLTLIDFGLLYIKMNEIDKAENSFKTAFEVASSIGLKGERRDAAKHLSEVFELQGKYKDALNFHKIYKMSHDSLFNRDLARRMAFQEAEYNYQQKQLEEEAERNKSETEQARILDNALWVRNSLVVGLVFMILISYLLYINFKRKKYANQALKKLNEQIESQAEELRRANLEITVMNNNLETIVNKRTKELKRKNQQLKDYLSSNSHIVRAPLARILGLVDLYEPGDSQNLDFINESLHASAKELDDALREINEKLSDNKA